MNLRRKFVDMLTTFLVTAMGAFCIALAIACGSMLHNHNLHEMGVPFLIMEWVMMLSATTVIWAFIRLRRHENEPKEIKTNPGLFHIHWGSE